MQAIARIWFEEVPFDPADATEPIVHRFWVSAYGAGERLERTGGSVSLMRSILSWWEREEQIDPDQRGSNSAEDWLLPPQSRYQ
jgi:hypothetical protein